MADSGVAGYFMGGYDGGYLSATDKLTFSSETKTVLGTALSSVVVNNVGMANSGAAGFSCGGSDSSDYVNTINQIAFPSDTVTTAGATLSTARQNSSAFGNSGL